MMNLRNGDKLFWLIKLSKGNQISFALCCLSNFENAEQKDIKLAKKSQSRDKSMVTKVYLFMVNIETLFAKPSDEGRKLKSSLKRIKILRCHFLNS